MSIVEENADLFTNGQFKAMIGSHTSKLIVGCKIRNGNYSWQLGYPQDGMIWRSVQRCTIMARPMRDMNKSEVKTADSLIDYGGTGIHGDVEKLIKHVISKDYSIMGREVFLYLRSIGVYFFDQNHFNEGLVIDITKT